jgi:hypothetical protein
MAIVYSENNNTKLLFSKKNGKPFYLGHGKILSIRF